MASKRDLTDVEDGEVPEPQVKRPRKQNTKTRQHQNANIDATWGQKYVFSDMGGMSTIPAGEESDFEDDTDAMAYLRSVRQEANGIPHLLVAPKVQIGPQLPSNLQRSEGQDDSEGEAEEPIDRSIYTYGIGDTRGWYEDGAYIARSEGWEFDEDYEEGGAYDEEEEEEDPAIALQEAYFASLMDKYLHLRSSLNSEPPPEAALRLSKDHPISAAPMTRSSPTIGTWTRLLRATDPHPLQIALMHKDSVLRITRVLLGGKFLRSGYSVPERTSRWIWALLARLPERGELNHLEIGWIRDLGRRAVLLGRTLSEMAALREELADDGLGMHEAVDESSTDENVIADVSSDELDGMHSPDDNLDIPSPPTSTAPVQTKGEEEDEEEAEEGEVEEDEDVAMDTASDSDSDNGAPEQKLEDAKSRLLAQLDAAEKEAAVEAAVEAAKERSRMNMRATLNMILTVAGEFYGQRDLLEFREPFVGM